jgi:hypothetical protein
MLIAAAMVDALGAGFRSILCGALRVVQPMSVPRDGSLETAR